MVHTCHRSFQPSGFRYSNDIQFIYPTALITSTVQPCNCNCLLLAYCLPSFFQFLGNEGTLWIYTSLFCPCCMIQVDRYGLIYISCPHGVASFWLLNLYVIDSLQLICWFICTVTYMSDKHSERDVMRSWMGWCSSAARCVVLWVISGWLKREIQQLSETREAWQMHTHVHNKSRCMD